MTEMGDTLIRGGIGRRERGDLAAIVAALAVVGGVVVLDQILQDRSLFSERPPDLSALYLARSLALLTAGVLGLRAARAFVDRRFPLEPSSPFSKPSVRATVLGLLLAAVPTALVLIAPSSIANVAEEDGIVEWLSAVFAFAAAGLVGAEALRRRRSVIDRDHLAVALLLAIAVLIALVGLEEVSWFQRQAGFDSPAAFEARNQPELNIHNYATSEFENAYYLGAFVFAVLIPHLLAGRSLTRQGDRLRSILPSRMVFYGAAIAAAMTFEMWEIIPIQLAFFVTVAALVTDPAPPGSRPQAITVAVTMIAVQGAFLLWGDHMARSWDDTELRELIIPFGFLLYGLDLWRRR